MSKVTNIHSGSQAAIPTEDNQVADSTLFVALTVGQARELMREVLREERQGENRHGKNGLLKTKDAAEYLGYSKDWVYRHWKKIGGKKLTLGGLRFSRRDLEKWVASRKTS